MRRPGTHTGDYRRFIQKSDWEVKAHRRATGQRPRLDSRRLECRFRRQKRTLPTLADSGTEVQIATRHPIDWRRPRSITSTTRHFAHRRATTCRQTQ